MPKNEEPRRVRTQRVTAPEVRYRRRTKRDGTAVTEVALPIPEGGVCSTHGAFWPVFLDAESGEPLCPYETTQECLTGAAELVDREAAREDVRALHRDRLARHYRIPTARERAIDEAMDLGGELPTHAGQFLQAYQNVTAAADARRHRVRLEKLVGFMGIGPDDDLPPAAAGANVRLLTVEEVAEVFSLKPETLHGKSRPSFLPAPLRLGKRLYWRADAILSLMRRGGPNLAHVPSIPEETAK